MLLSMAEKRLALHRVPGEGNPLNGRWTIRAKNPDDVREPDAEGSWAAFLHDVSQPQGPLGPACADQVRGLWSAIKGTGLPVSYPHAAVTPDGGLSMVWDHHRHHFEIEVAPDGSYDWFYLDRESDLRAGAEAIPPSVVSSDMFSFLQFTVERG